jgi:hypothetical protein
MPPDNLGVTEGYLVFWTKARAAEANRGWIAEDSAERVGFLVAGGPVHEDVVGRPVIELIGRDLLAKVWATGIADAAT